MQSPDFWREHQSSGQAMKELSDLKEEVGFWQTLEARLGDYLKLSDEELEAAAAEINDFYKKFHIAFLKIFLSGKYDKGKALLYVYSGAGGVDAQDWAGMLFRMYQRYCQRAGYGWEAIEQSLGEQGGIKSALAEISGRLAYGFLKGESGVHRLVRISPFSAKGLRHTSFALVDVLPEIEDVKLDIKPDELKMDSFRSSGPGGQNVNKVSTAVRLTHLPTGITVVAQSERSQAQNRERALKILQSKLIKMMEDAKVKELTELKALEEPGGIEWGSQIRSYVLNPYKLVKDHRTNVGSTDPEDVLEGNLDEFIEAEATKLKADD